MNTSHAIARPRHTTAAACFVLALSMLALLTGTAQAQTYPVGEPQIFISPTSPTISDIISITIRGTNQDSCVPTFDSGGLFGSEVRIFLVEPPSGTPCSFAFTDYEIGPLQLANPLPAGQYQVKLFLGGFPFGSPKSFTVGQGGGGGPQIFISPTNPTTNDIVSILIRGTHPDSCVPSFDEGIVSGSVISIFLVEPPSGTPCSLAFTDYEIGPLKLSNPLAAGQYQVKLFLDGSAFGNPKNFTVVQAGGGGGNCSQDLNNGVICLRNGRFELSMQWTDFSNNISPVIFKKNTDEVALGVFQNNTNDVTLIAKVTNGCPINGNYWVWLGAFTASGLDLTVRDTMTGQTKTYGKNLGGLMTTIKDDFTFPCN